MTTTIETADIVEQLRAWEDSFFSPTLEDVLVAADEIERLRRALKEISDLFEYHSKTYDSVPSNLYLMAKIARQALGEE